MDESVDIRFIMNSPEVEQEAARVKSSISGIEKTAESTTKAVSDAFSAEILNTDEIEEKVKIQKAALKELERAYEEARKKMDGMAPGQAKETVRQELAGVKQEIEGEKVALTELTKVQEQYEQSTVSIRTRIRNLKEEMATMTEGTEAYIAKMHELGELQDLYGDITAQGTVFADDEKHFRATTEAIQGVSGAMSAAVGMASLLGASEENLIKIQTRLQAVMAISVGVNQVAQVLNKDSYFSLLILGKAKNMLTVATTRLTVALGISNGAAKRLMATLTLGLSMAIGVVITMMSKWQSKREEQRQQEEELRKGQEKYYTAIADNVAKSLAEYRKLQGMWTALNGDSKKQQKFLKEHADKFKELGVKVTSVRDAENLLIKNEAKFIQSLMNRARAAAAMELAAEKYKIAIEKMSAIEGGSYTAKDRKQAEIDVAENGFSKEEWEAAVEDYGKAWMQGLIAQRARVIAAARLKEEIYTAESEAERHVIESLKSGKTADKLLKEAGITPMTDGDKPQADVMKKYGEAVLKSMADLERSRIAILKEGKAKELRELKLRRDETLAQIKKDQKDLAEAYKAAGRGELTQKDKEGFAERERNANQGYEQDQEEINKKYEKNLTEVYRGLSDVFLTEEERKRVELKRTYDQYREQAKKMFEGGDIDGLQYADLVVRIKRAEDYESVKDLVAEFRDYEEQRLAIAKEYDDKIAELEKQNTDGKNDRTIAEAKRQRDRALADFDASISDSTSLWSQLFDNFAHYTNQELQSIADNARQVLDYINSTPAADMEAKFGLTAEQLRNLKANAADLMAIYDAMGNKLQELNKRNPFAAIARSVKTLRANTKELAAAQRQYEQAKASGDKNAIKTAGEVVDGLKRQKALLKGDLKEAAKAAVSYLGDIGNSLQQIGESSGDAGLASFGKMLGEVSGIAQQALSGDYIGAAISAITTGLTAIFSSRAKYKASLRQMKQDAEEFAHEYKLVMADIELAGKDSINIFSEDSFKRAMTALRQMQDMYEQFLERVNKKDTISSGGGFIGRLQAAVQKAKGIVTDLQNIKIVTRHKTAFRSEKSTTLKELHPDLFDGENGFDAEAARVLLETNDQLNDQARRQIQEVIDLYDQWKEAEEAFKEYLNNTFGEIGNSLGDSIVTAFEDGTDAMEKWAESFNNVLKNLAKQLMTTLFFQKHFDQLNKDLTAVYDQFGDDPDQLGSEVTKLLGNFFGNMEGVADQAADWYKNFAEEAKKHGFDLSGKDSAATGVSGQLQAQMTEGTASQLVGLWNITAMEIRQVRELTVGQLAISSEIRDHVGALLVQMILIERNTRETADNTAETVKRLETMTDKLTDIEKNTKPSNSRM